MTESTISQWALDELHHGMLLILEMEDNGDYFGCIKGISYLMEVFREEDEYFVKQLSDLRNSMKDKWRSILDKTKTKK